MSGIEIKRHSLSHLLAAAVKELYPEALLSIGPAIDNGFYYDIDFGDTKIGDVELKEIEKKMKHLAKQNVNFERSELEIEDAIAKEKAEGSIYKVELLEELKKDGETKASYYTNGKFTDLCRGPHVENSKEIKEGSWMLDKLAGAYWRGDENNKMLTRIYGLAFETKDELADYLKLREEAEKRDHRKLGKELNIFTFDEEVGPGLPLWLPNGAILIEEIERLGVETENAQGYQRVRTPHLAQDKLYLRSGHLPYYEESMYPPMVYDGGKYYLKAMNCPHHHKIFAARPHSYKEMPIRYAEYGTCYRHEYSGELFGLMRVRSMQMNDAHIYCTEEQFFEEFKAVIGLYLYYFKIFGIDKYVMRLSKHSPDKLGKKYVNEPELWTKTEAMVRKCLEDLQVPFVEAEDEAAFYGPKIDVEIWSAIGREFTIATNQVDFAVPARFNLKYVDKDGQEKTPLCIHRAPLSTHERLIGFLIEHYAGAFPVWLSPVQAKIVSVGEAHRDYANQLAQEFRTNGMRTEVDNNDETVGNKIRKASAEKVPYVLVVGDKEVESDVLAVRDRGGKDTREVGKQEFIGEVIEKIKTRT